ncbi:MAG: hypothetical protein ACM3SW_04520 [Actinomycetota bacterium]
MNSAKSGTMTVTSAPGRKPASEVGTQVPESFHAHEIGKKAWVPFCGWLSATLSGMRTSIIRDEGSDIPVVECLDRPLVGAEPVVLANGVSAINVSIRMDGKVHTFEVAGPSWLRLHYNAAGFVVRVEIGYPEGKLMLIFTGKPAPGTIFTGNSWGE